jgi:hypothetical protein
MGEGAVVDLMDAEYAMPDEINEWVKRHTTRPEPWFETAKRNLIEEVRQSAPIMRQTACEPWPWPETAKRQIAGLESRVRHLERLVHGLLNQDR